MASVDLGRLRVSAFGPYWWSWNFGPWLVEFSWRRPEPPEATPKETQQAEEEAKRDFELALFDILREEEAAGLAKRLADLLDPRRFLQEAAVTHSGACDKAHAGCLAREVRELIHGKISSDGGGE